MSTYIKQKSKFTFVACTIFAFFGCSTSSPNSIPVAGHMPQNNYVDYSEFEIHFLKSHFEKVETPLPDKGNH